MAELVFIGLGLGDERDITLRGLEEARSCDRLFLETYTSRQADGAAERLVKLVGRPVEPVTRADVEHGTGIIEAASKGRAALLVVGDPMTATTHVDLRLRAESAGVRTRIVHNASIVTAAAGLLGLQTYKFGRTTTLVIPKKGYAPESPYDVIAANLKAGNHTLVLLDLDVESGTFMTANDGVRQLLGISARRGDGLITPETLVCVVARAGGTDCVVRRGPAGLVAKDEFGGPLHTVVVPGNLHDLEAKALDLVAAIRGQRPDEARLA